MTTVMDWGQNGGMEQPYQEPYSSPDLNPRSWWEPLEFTSPEDDRALFIRAAADLFAALYTPAMRELADESDNKPNHESV